MDKQDTAQQLRKVANFLKGVTQAADDIEAIGSMEGATREAQEARDKAHAERDQALTELSEAKAKGKAAVVGAKEKVEKMLADAKWLADEVASKTMAEADEVAKATLDLSSRQAGEMVAKATNAAMEWEQAVADLMVKGQALTAEVADLESRRTFAQAEHDKLTKALDKIKAQFRIEA